MALRWYRLSPPQTRGTQAYIVRKDENICCPKAATVILQLSVCFPLRWLHIFVPSCLTHVQQGIRQAVTPESNGTVCRVKYFRIYSWD
jgi:hypothetical protein